MFRLQKITFIPILKVMNFFLLKSPVQGTASRSPMFLIWGGSLPKIDLLAEGMGWEQRRKMVTDTSNHRMELAVLLKCQFSHRHIQGFKVKHLTQHLSKHLHVVISAVMTKIILQYYTVIIFLWRLVFFNLKFLLFCLSSRVYGHSDILKLPKNKQKQKSSSRIGGRH